MPESSLIQLSGDGSHTVLSQYFDDVTYHSRHGAITESNIVFVDAGLKYQLQNKISKIRVFEMGFGTGLNALLAYIWSGEQNIQLSYHTVEAYPVETVIAEQLNYSDILGERNVFRQMHTSTWNDAHILSENFSFQKYNCLIEDVQISEQIDVIFYDAFAPSSQPHLWDIPILGKMYRFLDQGGILVSYCAQGAFKRNLKSCGFTVESISGPPGKREMTRAIKA